LLQASNVILLVEPAPHDDEFAPKTRRVLRPAAGSG
jgi:hypothetical protein